MTEGQMQRKFTQMVGKLIEYAYANGYELSFGDAYRDPRSHGKWGFKLGYSAAHSQHKRRMAVDFNLFRNGRYLVRTEDHRELGEFWESLGGTWGGRWNDGNHDSVEYGGYR